jgi:hypothetical protein
VPYRDDLPVLSICRLRALGVITAETTTFLVKLGHVEQTVGVHLRKFPSGGSWSWFGCPTCGKWVRTLRLLGDEIVCRDCCERRGVRHRACTLSRKQRAERSISRLRAMLDRADSARLKPVLWGTMERRKRHEARLRECEFRVVHGRASGKTMAIDDPCNEPDFVAPKRPWPRSKPKVFEPG